MTDPLDRFPDFIEQVRTRLEMGAVEYGSRSLQRTPVELAGEIEEELADICGWAFLLWLRVRTLTDICNNKYSTSKG